VSADLKKRAQRFNVRLAEMCGRFVQGTGAKQLSERMDLPSGSLFDQPRLSVMPTTPIAAIRESRNGGQGASRAQTVPRVKQRNADEELCKMIASNDARSGHPKGKRFLMRPYFPTVYDDSRRAGNALNGQES
jgi:hypothetical protein